MTALEKASPQYEECWRCKGPTSCLKGAHVDTDPFHIDGGPPTCGKCYGEIYGAPIRAMQDKVNTELWLQGG